MCEGPGVAGCVCVRTSLWRVFFCQCSYYYVPASQISAGNSEWVFDSPQDTTWYWAGSVALLGCAAFNLKCTAACMIYIPKCYSLIARDPAALAECTNTRWQQTIGSSPWHKMAALVGLLWWHQHHFAEMLSSLADRGQQCWLQQLHRHSNCMPACLFSFIKFWKSLVEQNTKNAGMANRWQHNTGIDWEWTIIMTWHELGMYKM